MTYMVKDQIKGAIYLPSQAYNAYQMWAEYSKEETARDIVYAKRLNLNALRVWISYEYWKDHPQELFNRLDDFLDQCYAQGIRVMPVLFEKVGVEPTQEALVNKDPLSAFCVYSPGTDILNDSARWSEPQAYVEDFMSRFHSDVRVLAIEVFNEPFGLTRFKFARAMFRAAADKRGTCPLTIGCINLEHNIYFLDLGIDILQHHENFPSSREQIEATLKRLEETRELLDKPVWLTEWQRIRPTTTGWGDQQLDAIERGPDYAEYARILAEHNIGHFFWSLMVKPAYLPPQRKKGTINGVFHEDGAVWNLDDAIAISGDPSFSAEERAEWPEWAKIIPEHFGTPLSK